MSSFCVLENLIRKNHNIKGFPILLRRKQTARMIISYTHPYDLTQTPIFADRERDFERIPVNSSGYIESNKFLVSLWNQVNTHICPQHCTDRAPWAYFPGKYVGKKISVSVLGFCQTSIGELYYALEYPTRKEILILC